MQNLQRTTVNADLANTDFTAEELTFPVFIHALDEYERLMGNMSDFMADGCSLL